MLLDEVRNRGVMEEKTKRATFRIREAMISISNRVFFMARRRSTST